MATLPDSLTTRGFLAIPSISRISSPSASSSSFPSSPCSSSSTFPSFSPHSVLSYSHQHSHSHFPFPVAETLDDTPVEEELEFEQFEEFAEDNYADVSDDDDESIDISVLEKEARDIVRDYATTLSRELKLEDEMIEGKEASRKGKRQAKITQIPEDLLQRVAIVGRPNVGKSALFNRLVGV